MTKNPETTARTFELKGRMLTLTTLRLHDPNVVNLAMQLKDTVSQAPGLFQDVPVVLDLEPLQDGHKVLDFPALVSLFGNHGMVVVGVLGGNEAQREAAAKARLALFPDRQKAASEVESEPEKPAPEKPARAPAPEPRPEPEPVTTRLVTQPVRSGQQIYARGSDLIIQAPVSAGAEVIADGHIHVYGPLRGRAIAGASGDGSARIFCQSLEAELVSVKGVYRLKDDLDKELLNQAVQIRLDDDRLTIESL